MTLLSPSFYEGRSTGRINLEAPLHVVLAALPKVVMSVQATTFQSRDDGRE